ncbi:hypothetical protein [Bifidobacterium aquikefiri]|nr:hypothetical protein [Bifidobacterium aquikefiri]
MEHRSEKYARTAFVLVIIITSIRLIFGLMLPLTARSTVNLHLDDFLMIDYSHLWNHFHPTTADDILWAQVKPMSYPYFLSFIRVLGIPYRLAFTILWIISSLIASTGLYYLAKHLQYFTSPKWSTLLYILIYSFFVFSPVGFDDTTAQRIYRESIIPPTVFLIFGLILILIHFSLEFHQFQHNKYIFLEIAIGILLGITLAFFWYIKESSIWLAPLIASGILIPLVIQFQSILSLFRSRIPLKIKTCKVIAILIVTATPISTFGAGAWMYNKVNEHYFGVPYGSIRTEGEIAGFFSRLYQIKSPERTSYTWIPWSVMQKAINASPTLKSQTKLINLMRNSSEFGIKNWRQTPPGSDMGVWVMLKYLQQAGLYKNQRDPQILFAKINSELDTANLQQSSGFTPTSLLPKKNIDQIIALKSSFHAIWDTSVLWQDFQLTNRENTICPIDTNANNCRILETSLSTVFPLSNDAAQSSQSFQYSLSTKFSSTIFRIYRTAAPFLVLFSILGFGGTCILEIYRMVRKKHLTAVTQIKMYTAIISISCVLSVIALTTAVSWQYPVGGTPNYQQLKYYTLAFTPLIQILETIGVVLLIKFLKDFVSRKYYSNSACRNK